MGLSHSPRIVTNGLVLCLDAGNTRSYPGSGTTWTDLTGNGNNGTLTNGPTFSSSNGGSIVFDGVNDLSDHGTSSTLDLTTALTLDAWIYPTGFGGGSLGRIIQRTSAGIGYILFVGNSGIYTNSIVYVVNESSSIFTNINNTVELNTWANFSVTHGGGVATIYKNGVSIVSANLTQATTTSTNFYIGNRSTADRTFAGNIPSIKVYNRALSAAEIRQNFNATRGRYGI